MGIPLGQRRGRLTPGFVPSSFEPTAELFLSYTTDGDMPSTLDPESETVPQVTLALETLFKKLDDGLKINEESIRLVTGLIRALGTKFDATEALYREAP